MESKSTTTTANTADAVVSEDTKATDAPSKKSWASMFMKPKPSPTPLTKQQSTQNVAGTEKLPETSSQTFSETATPVQEQQRQSSNNSELVAQLSKEPHDALTEDNLDHLPDTSVPPATQTVASTVGSLSDARLNTPIAGQQQQQTPIGRPGLGGFASSTLRATSITGRSASFQKRILEQQEAVVMPGFNNADRASVQFGSMGLNGGSDDVDDERERAETRAQPPQQSPQGQPRASLPPAQSQTTGQSQETTTAQSMPTPKQAPGLPPAGQQGSYGAQTGAADSQQYNQYSRYGQTDANTTGQKAYDPFNHQNTSAYGQQYPGHQSSSQHDQQGQQGIQSSSAYHNAPSDYSQYYTAEQQRNAYHNYYGNNYGQQQQAQQSQQQGQQGQQHDGQHRVSDSLGQSENAYGSNQPNDQQVSFNHD